jgi:hypothetical protein
MQITVAGRHAGDTCTVFFEKNWDAPFWAVSIPNPLMEAEQAQGARVTIELLDNYGNLQTSTGWVCGWSETLAVIAGTDDWPAKTTPEWDKAVDEYRRQQGS